MGAERLVGLLRSWRCPFAAACEFRSDRAVSIVPTPAGARMTFSGRRRPLVLLCPLRRTCPLRAAADASLVRFEPEGVEVLRADRLNPTGGRRACAWKAG